MFSGNHWFQGDGETDGIRKAGLIFTTPNPKSTIVGNHIDNNFIELDNEHDATPDINSQLSFGGLTITGNIFTSSDVAPWFSWIVIKPYGIGHYIHGLRISGNVFRPINGNVTRVDRVDETYASLDMNKARNVVVQGNTFNLIDEPIFYPLSFKHVEASDSAGWTVSTGSRLPFGGVTKPMVGIVPDGKIVRSSNTRVTEFPYTDLKQGANLDQVNVTWSAACRDAVHLTVRMDTPT